MWQLFTIITDRIFHRLDSLFKTTKYIQNKKPNILRFKNETHRATVNIISIKYSTTTNSIQGEHRWQEWLWELTYNLQTISSTTRKRMNQPKMRFYIVLTKYYSSSFTLFSICSLGLHPSKCFFQSTTGMQYVYIVRTTYKLGPA